MVIGPYTSRRTAVMADDYIVCVKPQSRTAKRTDAFTALRAHQNGISTTASDTKSAIREAKDFACEKSWMDLAHLVFLIKFT